MCAVDSFNFAAGPAALPKAVIEQARAGLDAWAGSGLSVMELPFTGPEYAAIFEDAVSSLRQLLEIPPNYHVLLLQGGAYGQFSMVPMNLLRGRSSADYAVTGHWSRRAAAEARKYGSVNIAADGGAMGFTDIPEWSRWSLDAKAAYCHITTNETADGVQFKQLPETGRVPLVADVTSDFLTAPLDIEGFGAVYASAQKNAGTAGLTVVIVADELLGRPLPITPAVFDYGRLAENACKVNTPPVWAIFVAGLVFRWIRAEGGLPEMARRNHSKAARLYAAVDDSGFYRCRVQRSVRSTVNVCFHLPGPDLERRFLAEAEARGLHNLKGHAATGGIRASLYNAVGDDAVTALVEFMGDFAVRHKAATGGMRG